MIELFNTFVVLLIVIDPIGIAPLFFALTRHVEDRYRRRMAVRGTLLAMGMLVTFFFIGDALLQALGIGLPAFKIAGGILFFLLSIDMVFAHQSGLRSTTLSEQIEAEHKQDISVFPLAFPLIAGPGALTTVLLTASLPRTGVMTAGILMVLLLVLGLALLSLLAASKIMRLLGETGANVITRLLGLILAALAVQYVLDGIETSFT